MCYVHGGAAPQVKAAAARRHASRIAQAQVGRLLVELGEVPQSNPLETLIARHDEADAMVRLLRLLVGSLDLGVGFAPKQPSAAGSLYTDQPHVLVGMLGEWTDRHARIAKVLLDNDVDQRRLRLQSGRVEALFSAIMDAAGELLDGSDRDRFGEALALALQRRLAIGAGQVLEISA